MNIELSRSGSIQVNKDIIQEDFYVLHEEGDDIFDELAPETTTKVQISEPEKYKRDTHPEDITFDLTDDLPDEEQEVEEESKATKDAEELDEDFFEKGVDDDASKKQVVEEIAGMSEVVIAADSSEALVEVPEVGSSKEPKYSISGAPRTSGTGRPSGSQPRPSTIQFKQKDEDETEFEDPQKVASKTSQDRPGSPVRTSLLARRGSKIKSLLRMSTDGSMTRRMSTTRRESRTFTVPGTLGTTDLPFGVPADFYGTKRASDGRKATYSELGPRYRQMVDDDELDFFDMGGEPAIFFEVTAEEEEELVIQEEESPTKLERKPYYDRHDKAALEVTVRKIRNFILHKKLAMYFKRKKMDYVTRELDWSFDSQNKYNKRLHSYGELVDFMQFERARVSQDLDETKQLRIEKYKKLTNMFKKMQDREGEVGYGLISSKTGNALSDKCVERLIRRQNTQMAQVSSMRLTFIRLKGMVQEKLDAIASLNEIAPGFLLVDYEQLKSDNRGFADKIEEKDEELTRLRYKCGNTIQVLAHLREKTSALDNDLADLMKQRSMLEATYFVVRSRLNEQKQSRDTVRHALNDLREECGLLTQPTLLKDMEQGLSENEYLTDQLKHIMKEHKKKSKQIKTIRRKIEHTMDLRRGASRKDLLLVQSTSRMKKEKTIKLYKGRPSLLMPILEDSAFNSLKTIKPKFTYDRRHGNRINTKHDKRAGG